MFNVYDGITWNCFMKLNSKLLFFLIIFSFICNMLDIISATFILSGEGNPIYLLTKSVLLLFIVKLTFTIGMIIIYFKNEYPNRFWYYNFIYFVILSILLFTLGLISNIYGILHPSVIEESARLTVQQKMQSYSLTVIIFAVIPYIMAILSFKMFDITEHKIRYKGEPKCMNK